MATSESPPKKQRSTKLKALFSGRSKKKAASKKAKSANTSTVSNDEIHSQADISLFDDAPLVDDKSKGSALETAPFDEKPSLQLVLLLMDPATRRFELLQLEFDSDRARVADIMAQIPVSVTEEAIRNLSYKGVIDSQSNHMSGGARLADFCNSKEVLVALPMDLSIKDCARLARPILSDEKVIQMLADNGFDVKPWGKKTSSSKATTGDSSTTGSVKEEKQGFPVIALIAFVVIILQATQNYITAPIAKNVLLEPGTWRSKCGLAGLFPFCKNSYLQVSADGSSVSIYNDRKQLDFLIEGIPCGEDHCVNGFWNWYYGKPCEDAECIDGLTLDDSGVISMSGKAVKRITYFTDNASLTPWPFEEKPQVRMYRATSATSSQTVRVSQKQQKKL